jgi:hypothetical protein
MAPPAESPVPIAAPATIPLSVEVAAAAPFSPGWFVSPLSPPGVHAARLKAVPTRSAPMRA